jgi:hypothetical protein
MSAKLMLVAGATILSLVLGSAGGAAVSVAGQPAVEGPAEDAQIPRRLRARAYGVLASIDGGTLATVAPTGPVDFITDANTLFFAGGKRAALGDFAPGDVVGAVGWREASGGVFHAFAVIKLAGDRRFPVAGKLVAVDEDTLTVEVPAGLLATVRVDDETTYRVRGVEDPGLDDLAVGMRAVARGTLNPDGSLQAQVVGAEEAGPRPARLRGKIVAIKGDAFTMRAAARRVVVQTSEATEFRVLGVENPTIADLSVGDEVAVAGVLEEGGTLRATLVIGRPRPAAPPAPRGR